MIGIDVTPLVLGPRRGVARALHQLLLAWHREPPAMAIHPIAPAPLPDDVPRLAGAIRPHVELDSHRALREAMPLLVADHDIRVLLSPWSAFPDVRIPVVAWVHEVPSVRHGPLEGRVRTWADRRWLKRNVDACAALLVPSRSTEADVLAAHADAKPKLHRIPCAFDPEPWRAAARVPPKTPYVLAVGTGDGRTGGRKKGLDVLFRAWSMLPLPGHELVVVGQPALPLPPGTRVVKTPSDLDLRRLYAGARALVYASRSEGFGYPPLEAMAAGTPVIASNTGSIPEVVGAAALLVEPGDAEGLAAALRRLGGDHELEGRLVHAGYARIREFDPQRIAKRVLDLLTACAAEAPCTDAS